MDERIYQIAEQIVVQQNFLMRKRIRCFKRIIM